MTRGVLIVVGTVVALALVISSLPAPPPTSSPQQQPALSSTSAGESRSAPARGRVTIAPPVSHTSTPRRAGASGSG